LEQLLTFLLFFVLKVFIWLGHLLKLLFELGVVNVLFAFPFVLGRGSWCSWMRWFALIVVTEFSASAWASHALMIYRVKNGYSVSLCALDAIAALSPCSSGLRKPFAQCCSSSFGSLLDFLKCFGLYHAVRISNNLCCWNLVALEYFATKIHSFYQLNHCWNSSFLNPLSHRNCIRLNRTITMNLQKFNGCWDLHAQIKRTGSAQLRQSRDFLGISFECLFKCTSPSFSRR